MAVIWLAPVNYVMVKLPVQIGREHPALKLMNVEMSNLVINPNAPAEGRPSPHAYVLNDGITPISSALYLPLEAMRKSPILQEQGLQSIRENNDVHLSRAFRGMDHISFLDGKPPRRLGSKDLVDQVHPEQRSIFQWIIHDLLENVPAGETTHVTTPETKL